MNEKINNRQKVRKWMLKYDKSLSAEDPRFRNTVIVRSLDNFSFMVFENAFCIATVVRRVPMVTLTDIYSTYYMVFPEHSEPSLYEGTEFSVKMYRKIRGEYINLNKER